MTKQQEPDLIEAAWGIIANAGGSDWNRESPEWRTAAERWRERYHAYLADTRPKNEPSGEPTASEVMQDDILEILRALGLSYHARPASPHSVVQDEILPAILQLRAAHQADLEYVYLRGFDAGRALGVQEAELRDTILSQRGNGARQEAEDIVEKRSKHPRPTSTEK